VVKEDGDGIRLGRKEGDKVDVEAFDLCLEVRKIVHVLKR
jgi:hypothetical protein